MAKRARAPGSLELIPVTRHASERMNFFYGTWQSGYFPAEYEHLYEIESDDRRYYYSVLRTTCDAEGRFEFERLPDGEFYVETHVTWWVEGLPQGGRLMKRVQTAGGKEESSSSPGVTTASDHD